MSAEQPFVSQVSFHVRYAETDSMGLVHHAAYLVWFEEGRSAYIRDCGWSYASIEESGYFLAATDLQARYLKPARYDQLVTVKTWIAAARSRTIAFACHVHDQAGSRLFEATLKLVCLDARGRPTRLPKSWASWLRP